MAVATERAKKKPAATKRASAKVTQPAKAAPKKAAKKATPKKATPKKVELLSGGNPRIAKADGDAPVQAYYAALPGWKNALGRRLDALVVAAVPTVKKAVKWNSPFYGIEGQGWFLSIHAFNKYLKLAFFRGVELRPPLPGGSKSPDVRYLDIHEKDSVDETQLTQWLRQAAAIPGWTP